MLLEGVHVPLTTPFYPDGRVYLRKLEHNVRRYSLTPVSGLIALGDASESAYLEDAEQREVLRAVAETAAPEKVLTATLNQAGCDPALALAKHAASLQFDTLLLAPPAQLLHDVHALETWFQVLADRAPLPCVLASRCGAKQLAVDMLSRLAEHPNVIGIVESSQHISRVADLRATTVQVEREVRTTTTFTAATARMLRPKMQEAAGSGSGGFVSAAALTGGAAVAELAAPVEPTLRTRTKRVSTQILWAHAADATGALRAGAAGIAPALAAAVPQAVFEVWAAWKDGDTSLMHEKQHRVASAEPLFTVSSAPRLKAGAELSGYFGGRPRLPEVAPSASERDEIAHALAGMRS